MGYDSNIREDNWIIWFYNNYKDSSLENKLAHS